MKALGRSELKDQQSRKPVNDKTCLEKKKQTKSEIREKNRWMNKVVMKLRVSPGKPSFNIDFLITNSDLKTHALISSWSNRNQRQWVKLQPFKFLCVSLMLCLIQGDNYETRVSKTVCLNGNTAFWGKNILLLNFLEFFSKWKNKPSHFLLIFFFFLEEEGEKRGMKCNILQCSLWQRKKPQH